VPGHLDGWSLVQRITPTPGPLTDSPNAGEPAQTPTTDRRWWRTRALAIGSGALVLVLAGAGVAVAQAHKTVTLDVDGHVSTLSTFAGSVETVLAAEHVSVGDRDLLSADGALSEGQTIVVRHAHPVTVVRDGVADVVWTTALTAEEALADLAVRGGVVTIAASRSSAGRVELPLDLRVSGSVDVHVDGTTLVAPAADASVGEVLDQLGVVLAPLDRVSVTTGPSGRLQVVVARVVVQRVTTTVAAPFASSTVNDANRYVGTRTVTTAGVAGTRTVVQDVTTIDGVETARVGVSDELTTAPVDEVVTVGTKARPRAASSVPATSGASGSLNWAALAGCESGGRANAVSASGKYYGLYQFSVSTWQAVGGSGLPSQASAAEQTARALALYERSGAGQWPTCGRLLFS